MTKKKVQVKKSPYPSITVFTSKSKMPKVQFPSIPRLITEGFVKIKTVITTPAFFIHVFSVIMLLAIAYEGNVIFQTWKRFTIIQQEEAKLYQEVSYWQDITTKFANYRDGYFSLAVLYYRLGNDGKARENIEKVLSIDPRFEQGIVFSKLVEK